MKYHPNIRPFYLIQMLCGRAQLFLTDPRNNKQQVNNTALEGTAAYFSQRGALMHFTSSKFSL